MFLKKIHIHDYKIFNNIEMNFEKSDISNVFSLASVNGGGKSTLLQFIFIILNCFMDGRKKQYIVNLLEGIHLKNNEKKELINFIINHDNIDYNLDFLMISSTFEDIEFHLYNKRKELKIQLMHSNRKLRQLERKFENTGYERYREQRNNHLFHNKEEDDDEQLYKKELKQEQDLIKSELHLVSHQWERLQIDLKNRGVQYITHIDDENILLIKTDMDDELLKKLSEKVFLASPSSQVFHFFQKEAKNLIFKSLKNEEKQEKSYSQIIEDTKMDIKNFFTYDFFSSEIILEAFEKSFKEDRKLKVSKGEYGKNFDNLSEILEKFLEGKTISVNEDFSRVIYRFKDSNQELSPLDLSHGELKKLSIFIWLKYLVEEDSIVLMDEIDIALHPSWQYDLVDDLEEWSKNTQFFIATHSAQILSSTYYKNLVLLQKEENKVTLQQPNKPLNNNDINSVIDVIMGTNHLPKKLDKLHMEYRNLVKEGKDESQNALDIKNKILEWENINSSFFRRIDFFKKMKK